MRIGRTLTLLGGSLLAMGILASCSPRVMCDAGLDAGTFIGRVLEKHGSTVTFRVETVQREPSETSLDVRGPVAGTAAVVHYEKNEEQFVHVGARYAVRVWPVEAGYFSGVHTANHTCSGGTVYADGTSIDTALVHQPHLRHVLLEYLAGLAAAGLIVAGWAVRKRRRQRKNVEELRAESNS
jgi:hypothetical protein